MLRCRHRVGLICQGVLGGWLAVACLSTQASAQAAKVDAAARVGSHSITARRIDAHLRSTLGDRKLSEAAQSLARATSLEHLVNRRVLFDYLQTKGFTPSSSRVQLEVEKFEQQLARVGKTLPQHLEQTFQTDEQLEYELAWKLAWAAYLKRYLTEQNLERYFESNRHQYDGTQIRVAHLLLPGDQPSTGTRQAEEIRQQIARGDVDWATAVAKHSRAPSTDRAGEIGWIKFSGPMPGVFNEAAFKLQPGQLSPPVVSAFGVHLIKCLELQPGSGGWREVQVELQRDATRFLFDRLAAEHRPQMEIVYSDDHPHLRRKDGETVLYRPEAGSGTDKSR